jgi:monoamine oxidase
VALQCVGGRTRSAVREGYRWDVGGQWLGPTQTRMLNLCSELGLATFPQYTEGTPLAILFYCFYFTRFYIYFLIFVYAHFDLF